MIDTSGSCSLAVMLSNVLWLQWSCGVLLFVVLAVMPLSSPLLKRKTYVSWLKKFVVFFGWFDSPETIHTKPVWRNESRALAAVRGERWKRNGIGSRRMSDWQQESRVHERVPILVIYEHTILELWRWAFLCFENFFEWNFCWMSWQRKTTFGVYAEGSFLRTASWLLKFESTDALNHVPTRNATRSLESSKMESLSSNKNHLFRIQPGKSTAGPPKR